MTNWLVSRHQGAIDFIRSQGVEIHQQVQHLNLAEVKVGDVIYGTLPIQLAAAICAKGARYMHLTLNLPFELRGKEISLADLHKTQPKLEEFKVIKVE